MSKTIQIRDVPDHVHRTLKSRAASEGISLSDFVRQELTRIAERPSVREWLELTQDAKPNLTMQTAAEMIRGLRESR